MEKINNLFDQEITKTVDAYPSIFSKDDVVNLLSSLRTNVLNEISINTPTTGYDIDTIVKAAEDILENFPFDECIEIEPELNGSYNGNYSLEFNTSFDDRTFIRNFSQDLSELLQQDKE
jgi:hypothetical protein